MGGGVPPLLPAVAAPANDLAVLHDDAAHGHVSVPLRLGRQLQRHTHIFFVVHVVALSP